MDAHDQRRRQANPVPLLVIKRMNVLDLSMGPVKKEEIGRHLL